MATFTAQILIGSAHPNHGGINPTHQLYLSENSHPAWLLVPAIAANRVPSMPSETLTWIPTHENILEDALLMIALHVVRDPGVSEAAERLLRTKTPSFATLREDIDKQDLQHLHEKSRAVETGVKLVITVMEGSTVMGQLKVLEQYRMEVEVCTTLYSRSYSRWQERIMTRGALDDLLPG